MESIIMGAINTVRMAKMECCLCLLQQGMALVAHCAQEADPALGRLWCGLKGLAAPVLLGMMLKLAALPPLQSLAEGTSTVFWVAARIHTYHSKDYKHIAKYVFHLTYFVKLTVMAWTMVRNTIAEPYIYNLHYSVCNYLDDLYTYFTANNIQKKKSSSIVTYITNCFCDSH